MEPQWKKNFNRRKKYGNPNWQRGVSGNPKGRPKNVKLIPDILREIGDYPVNETLLNILEKKYGPEHKPKNMREAMLMAAYFDAANGNKDAREFIAERTEGRISDNVNLYTNPPGKVIFEEVLVGEKILTNANQN